MIVSCLDMSDSFSERSTELLQYDEFINSHICHYCKSNFIIFIFKNSLQTIYNSYNIRK